jgi:hypothetical protein
MSAFEHAEISEDKEYITIWRDGKSHSYLIDDVIEKMPRNYVAEFEAMRAELDLCMERIARLDSIIHAARHGEYDNAHDITAIRKFLYESMNEYLEWLNKKVSK